MSQRALGGLLEAEVLVSLLETLVAVLTTPTAQEVLQLGELERFVTLLYGVFVHFSFQDKCFCTYFYIGVVEYLFTTLFVRFFHYTTGVIWDVYGYFMGTCFIRANILLYWCVRDVGVFVLVCGRM